MALSYFNITKQFCVSFFLMNGSMVAGTICEQTVCYSIPQCLEISVTGNPSLQFELPAVGENFVRATASGLYSLSCNKRDYKILCKINKLIPDLVFQVRLEAPPGATSLGDIALSSTDTTIVSGISQTKIRNGIIRYTMVPANPNVLPAEVSGGMITVTFTLCS